MKHFTFARFLHLRAGVARIAAVLALSCLFSAALSAQNNPKISVQGTLKSANGATVADGPYTVTFNLYDVPTGGSVLWFEDAQVEVLGGIYTHYLGANKPLVAGQFNKTLYLGVKVNNYELVPRTEFSYAPYAFSVANAQSALSAEKVVCSGAVGDVKYSILNPTDFAKENGNCWVPMDGRSLAGSRLATHSSSYNHANLPDAGGMFFRAQEFSGGSDHDSDRNSNSPIATLQGDDFRSHNHTMQTAGAHTHIVSLKWTPDDDGVGSSANEWSFGGTGPVDITNHSGSVSTDGNHTHTINNSGGSETRPKNLNLWVYIRIN